MACGCSTRSRSSTATGRSGRSNAIWGEGSKNSSWFLFLPRWGRRTHLQCFQTPKTRGVGEVENGKKWPKPLHHRHRPFSNQWKIGGNGAVNPATYHLRSSQTRVPGILLGAEEQQHN